MNKENLRDMVKENLRDMVKENLIKVSHTGTGKTGKPFITETNNKIKVLEEIIK